MKNCLTLDQLQREDCEYFTGLPTGIRHHAAKLTEKQAVNLRIDNMAGHTLEQLAKRYQTSISTAHRVVRRTGRWVDKG